MTPSLKYPKLKIERAKEHLDALDSKLKEFLNSNPVQVTTEEDLQKGLYTLRLQAPIIDPKLAVIASDAIRNLRSALDHIVWQLALTVKERPSRQTKFPIIDRDIPHNMKRFKINTENIPDSAIDEIKAVQPYLRGAAYNDDLLWKLDKLCTIDKYRVLPAQGTALDNILIPKGVDAQFGSSDGIFTVTVPIDFKTQMNTTPPPSADILFGSEIDGIVISVRELLLIYDYVQDSVLPRFLRFFP